MPIMASFTPRGTAIPGRNMMARTIETTRTEERQYRVKELFDKVSEVFIAAGRETGSWGG